MPRPKKCRRVCGLPGCSEFGPAGCGVEVQPVLMTVEEYEAIRLIDYQGLHPGRVQRIHVRRADHGAADIQQRKGQARRRAGGGPPAEDRGRVLPAVRGRGEHCGRPCRRRHCARKENEQ